MTGPDLDPFHLPFFQPHHSLGAWGKTARKTFRYRVVPGFSAADQREAEMQLVQLDQMMRTRLHGDQLGLGDWQLVRW